MRSDLDAFSKFEHEGWQRVATKYENSWSALTRAFIEPLLHAMKLGPGMRLLDVACGPGYVAEAAMAEGAQPLGLDFSAEMIRLARQRNAQIDFREGDAQALPFADGSFDAVVMSFGLLHLAKPEAAFAESSRVLRTGGSYGFTVWAGPEDSPGAKLVEDAVKAHAETNLGLPQGPDYFAYGDREECRKALAAVGFDSDTLSFQTVTAHWKVPNAAFIFEAERHAGVRTAALLARQTPDVLAAIRQRIEDSVRAHAAGNGFAIPFAAHVIAVRKK